MCFQWKISDNLKTSDESKWITFLCQTPSKIIKMVQNWEQHASVPDINEKYHLTTNHTEKFQLGIFYIEFYKQRNKKIVMSRAEREGTSIWILQKPRPRSGVVAALRWTSRVEIPHVQGQRESPSKMAGGENSGLESNPISARDTQSTQTKAVCTRTQGPHRDWDRTVFEYLLWRYGEQWSATDRGSECGYGISPLGGGHH